jgi:hypothetical protein
MPVRRAGQRVIGELRPGPWRTRGRTTLGHLHLAFLAELVQANRQVAVAGHGVQDQPRVLQLAGLQSASINSFGEPVDLVLPVTPDRVVRCTLKGFDLQCPIHHTSTHIPVRVRAIAKACHAR